MFKEIGYTFADSPLQLSLNRDISLENKIPRTKKNKKGQKGTKDLQEYFFSDQKIYLAIDHLSCVRLLLLA